MMHIMHVTKRWDVHSIENERNEGIYFITGPDGYWIEIVPER